MPKFKVTMELDLAFDTNECEIRNTIMDALAEFRANRGDNYVERRYPRTEGYAWLNREEKQREVERRCRIASQLHSHSFLDIKKA